MGIVKSESQSAGCSRCAVYVDERRDGTGVLMKYFYFDELAFRTSQCHWGRRCTSVFARRGTRRLSVLAPDLGISKETNDHMRKSALN